MSKYYDFNFIEGVSVSCFVDLIIHALEQEKEELTLDLWKRVYPFMATGLAEFKSYEEFRNELLQSKLKFTDKSSDEIETELMDIIATYEGR